MRAMVVVVLVAIASCGGGDSGVDASQLNVCYPDGPYQIPPGCDLADCKGRVCDTTCHDGTTCGTLDCTDSPQCRLTCEANTVCGPTNCRGADVCFVACFSACEVDCDGSPDCGLECLAGAPCLLRCGASNPGRCGFQGECVDGSAVVDCGGGVFVCNRPCP